MGECAVLEQLSDWCAVPMDVIRLALNLSHYSHFLESCFGQFVVLCGVAAGEVQLKCVCKPRKGGKTLNPCHFSPMLSHI